MKNYNKQSIPCERNLESESSPMQTHCRLGLLSAYSLLYSPLAATSLFERLESLGIQKIAITDRDNLYGYPVYRELAQERGISLICGALLTESGVITSYSIHYTKLYEDLIG